MLCSDIKRSMLKKKKVCDDEKEAAKNNWYLKSLVPIQALVDIQAGHTTSLYCTMWHKHINHKKKT